jgi:hypothetical protein
MPPMARKGMGTFRDAKGRVWKFWKGRWRRVKPKKETRRGWALSLRAYHPLAPAEAPLQPPRMASGDNGGMQ